MTAHPDNRSLRHEIITMGANWMSYRKLSDQALDGPDFAEAFTEVIQQDAVPLPGLPTHRTVPNRPQPRGYQLHGTKKRRAEAEIPNQTRQETCPGGDLRRGTVELTANGHMRITGPGGVAIVGAHTARWRAEKNVIAAIRKYAGLEIRL
jgi:hypothetical protein